MGCSGDLRKAACAVTLGRAFRQWQPQVRGLRRAAVQGEHRKPGSGLRSRESWVKWSFQGRAVSV